MRVIIAGTGIQGLKRQKWAGSDFVGFLDPYPVGLKTYKDIKRIPLDKYDALIICTPYSAQLPLIEYCLKHGKHVMVEKPLTASPLTIKKIQHWARQEKLVVYTAYNHQFEPHFARVNDILKSGELGEIYSCRIFYGNGTAKNVKGTWKDTGAGVLPEIGSHLFKMAESWFGQRNWQLVSTRRVENKALDHAVAMCHSANTITLEMSYLSWANTFTCDIIGAAGSVHINGLCKWGPSTFTYRKRIFPSGKPLETRTVLEQPDWSFDKEYRHFKGLVEKGAKTDLSFDARLMKTFDEFNR